MSPTAKTPKGPYTDVLERRMPDGAQVIATWSAAVDKWHVQLIIPEVHNAMEQAGRRVYAGSGSLAGVAALLAYDYEEEQQKRARAARRRRRS